MVWYGDDEPRESESTEVGAGARLWPFVLTVLFGIVFAAIADLAWLTAIDTTGPWFTPTISAQVYTATLTTATLATLILASLAAGRLAVLDVKAREAAARDPDRGDPSSIPVEVQRPMVTASNRPILGDGLDQVLAELERFAEGAPLETRKQGPGGAVLAKQRPRAVGTGRSMPPALREALRRARSAVWQTVAGPLAVFLVFIAIGGAMLPGSGAFALGHYQLNTGLILFLGYGWPFLVAWTIAAIVLLFAPARNASLDPFGVKPGAGLEQGY